MSADAATAALASDYLFWFIPASALQFAMVSMAAALREMMPHFPRVLIETLWDEAERYFDRPDAADVTAFLRYLLAMSHLITVPEGEHTDRVKLATIHSTKEQTANR